MFCPPKNAPSPVLGSSFAGSETTSTTRYPHPSHDVRGLHVYPGALPQHQAALPDLRQLRDAFLVGAGHHQALVDARTQGHQEPQDANVPSGEGDIGQEGHGIEDLSWFDGWTSWTGFNGWTYTMQCSLGKSYAFIQNRPFIHKLQFSFKAMHHFFQERVSLQNIKQSSKAALLSVEVQSSFHRNIKPAFNRAVCLSKHQIPTQYAVRDWHSVLLSKGAVVDAHCRISWNKEKSLKKENAAYRLQFTLYSFK